MNWYDENGTSNHLQEWIQIYRRNPNTRLKELEDRHDMMLMLNPISASMQKMRLQLEMPITDGEFLLSRQWDFSECQSYAENT